MKTPCHLYQNSNSLLKSVCLLGGTISQHHITYSGVILSQSKWYPVSHYSYGVKIRLAEIWRSEIGCQIHGKAERVLRMSRSNHSSFFRASFVILVQPRTFGQAAHWKYTVLGNETRAGAPTCTSTSQSTRMDLMPGLRLGWKDM